MNEHRAHTISAAGEPRYSRRHAIREAAAWGASLAFLGSRNRSWGGESVDSSLILRSSRPLDLESPASALDHWLTPNNLFFVRSHFGAPAVGREPWKLELGGMVERAATLSLDELSRGHEVVTVPAVLQCSGNGRGYFRPRVTGVPWERGAVGHAEWSGVRLADVLERAGIKPGAGHVHLLGADGPPSPKTPAFFRSIPLTRALDPSTILATRMNGEPLPLLHGGPVRLAVPGWSGNHWLKWLRVITVSRDEAPGFFMQTGYRMPKVPAPPGAVLKPSDLEPFTTSAESPGRATATSRRSSSPPTATPSGALRRCSTRPVPGAGGAGVSRGTPQCRAATSCASARPIRTARRSPSSPPGTRAATSGTGSIRSVARSFKR
jgi:DMSO/TMAO reductase YedYZ molybdopterin-dependent catalytic subunit